MEMHSAPEGLPVHEVTSAKPWQARHDVQFYDDEAFLASSVAAFLAEGIKSAQPAVVIATPEHTRSIKRELRQRGVDVAGLLANDLVWLDARETLESFMVDGHPSAERFDAAIGSIFEKITSERRYVTVRAFGEMVDLVWRDGMTTAAIELEELWNKLATRYSFALLCAYSTESLDPADMSGMERICAAHNHVLPSPRA